MARKIGEPPPLVHPWGFAFCSPKVQRVMREAWFWPNTAPWLGSYLHHAFSMAMAYSERPRKRCWEATLFLRDYDDELNGWFFRLCAAVCMERTMTSTEKRITEAFSSTKYVGKDTEDWLRPPGVFVDLSTKEMAEYLESRYRLGAKPANISVVINRLRARHGKIVREWETRFPGFFTPIPLKGIPGMDCGG